MKVIAITVTYADRSSYVIKQVERLLEIGVFQIIVVDNHSVDNSRFKFIELAEKCYKKVIIHHLNENLGSAGGFAIGLEIAKSLNGDYVWLFDDDNLPQLDALESLQRKIPVINKYDMLISLRADRAPYKKIKIQEDVKKVFKTRNSFHGYDLLFDKKNYTLSNIDRHHSDSNLIRLPYGPYGGMFFNIELLDQINLPNKKYVLYRDDHEFSRRVIDQGNEVLMCLSSKIYEMESSWNSKSNIPFWGKFINFVNSPKKQAYYSLKNSYIFERDYLVNRPIVHKINVCIFLLLLTSISIVTLNFRKIPTFFLAIKDALNVPRSNTK